MIAPVFAGEPKRTVYLPEGEWFDFWTEKRYAGKQSIGIEASLNQIPIFVKAGSLLPLAQVTCHTEDPKSWLIEVTLYGGGSASTTIYEDDGTYEPELEAVTLRWNGAETQGEETNSNGEKPKRYQVTRWRLASG
jgi:alpha-D-xyloside xylohydrolase